MNRVFTVLVVFLVGAVAALLVLGYFAYVISAGPPDESRVRGLGGAVEVGFSEQGTSRVDASSLADAMVGLGYAQAAANPWPLTLYRAAATGRLSRLVGAAGLAVDERVIQLGMVDAARDAYAALGAADRDALDAFARGVNAALTNRSVLRDPSIVLSGATPDEWLPWHTLAIERLFAWLGSDPGPQPGSPDLPRPIRDFLRLHDFDQGYVVLSQPPSEPGLFVRYVHGSSALPVVSEASLVVDGKLVARGAALLGTPFFVAARSEAWAWAYLQTQTFAVETLKLDSIEAVERRSLLALADGSERLVSVTTHDRSVLLGTRGHATNDGIFVSWPGLDAISDAEAWLGLLTGKMPTFRAIAGTGVILSGDEIAYLSGGGPRLDGGRIVGSSSFLPYVAERIDSLMARSPGFNPRLWSGDTYSTWAADWVPRLVKSVRQKPIRDATEDEAVSYLRNWDYGFGPASIGASVFHVWAQEYYADRGHWPGLSETGTAAEAADTASAPGLWSDPLVRAARRLEAEYGSDLSVWRWEDVNASQIFFPVLGRADSSSAPGSPLARYAPRTIPGNGHPTTPNWSPIAPEGGRKAASSWEAWTRMTVPGEWTVRRWNPDVSRGVGSRRAPDENSTVTSLESSTSTRTRLIPERDPEPPAQTRDSGG